MTSCHNSNRQPALHAQSRPTPDRGDAGPTNVSNLYAAWLSQKSKVEALLQCWPATNDFAARRIHDATIGAELDVQWAIEAEIENCAEASPTSARAKIAVALDQAAQEFGPEPSLSWQMVVSALGDLQLIELSAAA